MASKNRVNSVSYDPKTPIGKLFGKLSGAKGKAVDKATLYKGVKAAPTLLAWILIHGRTSGLWTVKNADNTVTLTFTKKGLAAAKAAA